MAIGTGDLNPHWFHKPALLMYVLASAYGVYFVAGAMVGRFDTVQAFGAHFLNDPEPFLLIGRLLVAAAGVGVVWLAAAIARRAFRSTAAGVAAAAVAAVLTPLVVSSQEIKSDVPCAFLMALSVYLYLGVDRSEPTTASRRRWLLGRAAFAGGVALGMHYYAIVLVPAFVVAETATAVGRRAGLVEAGISLALLVTLFVAGFFVSSPFNFLDRSAAIYYTSKVTSATASETRYEPDRSITFQPGARTSVSALRALSNVVTRDSNLGWTLVVLIAAGMIAAVRSPDARTMMLLVVVPCALFVVAAVVVFPFHAAPRHLTPFLPLVCALVWPGARLLAATLTARRGVESTLAAAAIAGACIQPAAASIAATRDAARLDSRIAAYRWLVARVPHDQRLLLDDYGPALAPSRPSVERLIARLDGLPAGPFTAHQAERLALQQRYPAVDGFNFDELGHQWWLPSEKTDQALRSTPTDLDMGNPLVSRVPLRLDDYRRQGFRYVVTNSDGAGRYRRVAERFPSFARFYRELSQMTPIKTFDPADWNGKGPIVWVYDLDAAKALQAADRATR